MEIHGREQVCKHNYLLVFKLSEIKLMVPEREREREREITVDSGTGNVFMWSFYCFLTEQTKITYSWRAPKKWNSYS
jgi:hypothetical protein